GHHPVPLIGITNLKWKPLGVRPLAQKDRMLPFCWPVDVCAQSGPIVHRNPDIPIDLHRPPV
ncbi:MAG: hypothetical protein WD064_00430, partial [Acidimicrobiia bacterium]